MQVEARARSIDLVETAKLVREALKSAFPDVKFSVRTDRYSMGCSINVSWTDGPTEKQVEAITAPFASKGFDGMIDLAYYREAWLLPNGRARVAHVEGTEGSRGSVPEHFGSPMDPGAELVSFGADYVQCARDISPEFRARCVAKVTEALGEEPNPSKTYGSWLAKPWMEHVRSGYGDTIVQQVISRTATKPSDWIPEWRRPKPKGKAKPRNVLVVMREASGTRGQKIGHIYTLRGASGFYYYPDEAKVSYWGGRTPKYAREAVETLIEWATGQKVS